MLTRRISARVSWQTPTVLKVIKSLGTDQRAKVQSSRIPYPRISAGHDLLHVGIDLFILTPPSIDYTYLARTSSVAD